jgi:hypothetical protein
MVDELLMKAFFSASSDRHWRYGHDRRIGLMRQIVSPGTGDTEC